MKTKINKLKAFPLIWSILPEELMGLEQAYQAYLKRETTPKGEGKGEDVPATEAAGAFNIDPSLADTFTMHGDIAVMSIEGVITPKADIWSFIFGGATIDVMTRDFQALVNNDDVKAIVLDIDSPGGNIFGIQEFANLVFESRSSKPIVAITSTMMASAAMWIGAAASDVFITGETTVTGSLAALTSHIDISGLEQKLGVKTTEISSGPQKRIDSRFAPLTDDGRTELQSRVDYIGNVIAEDIARFRGLDIKAVIENISDGSIFMGSQGIEAGLIDGKMSFDDLIDNINAELSGSENNNDILIGGQGMFGKVKASVEALKEGHLDIYNAVFAVGATSERDKVNGEIADAAEKARIEGQTAGETIGAKNELARILAVEAQLMPGHEELIAKFVADGMTTGQEAAAEVIKADNSKRAAGLNTLRKDSPDAASDSSEDLEEQDQGSDPIKAAWEKGPESAALKKEFGGDYDSYKSYFENDDRYKETGEITLK